MRAHAEELITQDKYKEATSTYEEAQKKWRSSEVDIKIKDAKILDESQENFDHGSKYIDDEDWDEAVVTLLKVNRAYKNYDSAQSLVEYAKDKLNEEDIMGVKDAATSISKNNIQASSPVSTSTPTELPVPTIMQNFDSICNAKQESWEGELKAGFNQIILDTGNQLNSLQADTNLWSLMNTKIKEMKVKLTNCMITCSPKYYLFCIENKGNTDYFNLYDQCPVCKIN